MKKQMTCIVCPIGCALTVESINGEIVVSGNTCARGKQYAKDELLCPKRTVTTTVRCTNGTVVAVKTENPIDKGKIFECMQTINAKICTAPVSIGDVIAENVCGSRIVATQNSIDF